MRSRAIGLAGGLLVCVGVACATPIDSRGFFDPYNPTVITWDVDGAGAPVVLLEGGTRALPANEYQAQGFTFSQQIAWVNDASATFNAAQAIIGSPEIAIPSAGFNAFSINFVEATDAFAFAVIHNSAVATVPSFSAFDAQNQLIETVSWGPQFVDGTIGTTQYGYMGIFSPDRKIARIALVKQAAIFDDFLFATVPTPGAAAILGMGLAVAGRRRR